MIDDDEKPLTESIRAQVKRVLARGRERKSGFFVVLNGGPAPMMVMDGDRQPRLFEDLQEAEVAVLEHDFMGIILQWDGPSATVVHTYYPHFLDEDGNLIDAAIADPDPDSN